MQKIRKSFAFRALAGYLALAFFTELVFPTALLATGGGPGQPETRTFTRAGGTDVVNLATGDMNYSIDLFEVGGYPITLGYSSAISMDQEASSVGLGWNLNPGSISRSLRGLPDDFKGDEVRKEFYMKPNHTFGLNISPTAEIFGLDADDKLKKLGQSIKDLGAKTGLGGYSLGFNLNNYNGLSITQNISLSKNKGAWEGSLGLGTGPNGLSLSPNLSYSYKVKREEDGETKHYNAKGSFGLSINSTEGLKAATFGLQATEEVPQKNGINSGNEPSGAGTASSDSEIYKGTIKEPGTSKTSKGLSGAYSFATPTYLPSVQQARRNFSFAFSLRPEGSFFGIDGIGAISAMYSGQFVVDQDKKRKAYGYMNKGAADDHSLLDFNREKESVYHEGVTNVALANQTYDVFSITGQGVGGTFRAHHSQVGHVADPYMYSGGVDANFSLEGGFGNLSDLGTDIRFMGSESTSGKWTKRNNAKAFVENVTVNTSATEEAVYFKMLGEHSVDESDLFNRLGKYDPVAFKLDKSGIWDTDLMPYFVKQNRFGQQTTMSEITAPLKRNQRAKRNTLIVSRTVEDMEKIYGKAYTNDEKLYMQDHHIAQVEVTRTDGMRYIYGEPAYNKTQIDASFSISKEDVAPDVDCETGLVSYNPTTDAVRKNGNGESEYYSKTTLPAYARDYLLTEVQTADYVPVVAGELNYNDQGNCVKFTYEKVEDYQWRIPFDAHKANYNPVIKSKHGDDKASYLYGKKDLKYLTKIESKDRVVIFDLGDRDDAREVAGEDGGLGTQSMKKLRWIKIFSRPEWEANGPSGTPLRTVHFEYDYSLCGKVPNNLKSHPFYASRQTDDDGFVNQGGKLTLKKVYFTNLNSLESKYEEYEFEYSSENADYSLRAQDIWGSYKNNVYAEANNGYDCLDPEGSPVSNTDNPYVKQDKVEADQNVQNWRLTKITMPSKSEMTIEYESDDYNWVQNRRAMQMFQVVGGNSTAVAGPRVDSEGRSYLYEGNTWYPYIFFSLGEGVVAPNDDFVKDNYFGSIFDNPEGEAYDGYMYFDFLVDLDHEGHYDGVGGYAEVVDAGKYNDNTGWVQLAPVNRGDLKDDPDDINNEVNAISRAAWVFTRNNNPKMAKQNPERFSEPGEDKVKWMKNAVKTMSDASFITQAIEFAMGPHGMLKNKQFGKKFEPSKSWIRLDYPESGKGKLGGGLRVKTVKVKDNWGDMSDEGESFTYGKRYFYDDKGDGSGISTGVASYEPAGSKENPFVLPVVMKKDVKWGLDEEHYTETPYGSSFFPAATVVYAKVTEENINNDVVTDPIDGEDHDVSVNGTGKIEHEFYTSRNYPTIVREVKLDAERKSLLAKLTSITGSSKDFITLSQGYCVIANGMNGTPKANWVYDQGGDRISGVEYIYSQSDASLAGDLAPEDQQDVLLNNQVKVIRPDGSVEEAWIGVEYDVVADFRESNTQDRSIGVDANLSTFLMLIFPGITPSLWPTGSWQHTRFRSAVVTKVVHMDGILEKVKTYDNGAVTESTNIAWDSETGEVLLVGSANEFGDQEYTFTYPAHWAYEGMGQAYKNIGVSYDVPVSALGTNSVLSSNTHLLKGDEIFIENTTTGVSTQAWVWGDETMSEVVLIDISGKPVLETSALKDGDPSAQLRIEVLRSGRRNLPMHNIGAVRTKNDPIASGSVSFTATDRILTASAVEYTDQWQKLGRDCQPPLLNTPPPTPEEPEYTNPYRSGLKGNWRAKRSYTYYGTDANNASAYARTQTYDYQATNLNQPLDKRNDGIFTEFDDFWNKPAGGETFWTRPIDDDNLPENPIEKWAWVDELTKVHPVGTGIEHKNALDIYSSKQLGFANTRVTAVAANSKVGNMAFDGFEDYDYTVDPSCEPRHFGFDQLYIPNADINVIKTAKAHSGNHCVEFAQGGSKNLTQWFHVSYTDCDEHEISDADLPYESVDCDHIEGFLPESNGVKKYVLSYWVSANEPGGIVGKPKTYLTPTITHNFGTALQKTLLYISPVIEGWQKVEYEFTLSGASMIAPFQINFNKKLSEKVYLDDIRIHPVNSNMVSYVYDYHDFRVMAELDQNNFATFYEYDEAGHLIRVEKETEAGRMTIKENRSYLSK